MTNLKDPLEKALAEPLSHETSALVDRLEATPQTTPPIGGMSSVLDVGHGVSRPEGTPDGDDRVNGGLRGWLKTHPTSFSGAMRTSGKVLKVVTAPWWWPVGYTANELLKAPARLKGAALTPFHVWIGQYKVDNALWQGWTPAQRLSVLKQAGTWVLLLVGALVLAFSLPGPMNLVPILLVAAVWYLRRLWDPVRFMLGLPQLSKIMTQAEKSSSAEGQKREAVVEPVEIHAQEVTNDSAQTDRADRDGYDPVAAAAGPSADSRSERQ